MPEAQIQSLITTINELEKLDTHKLSDLLEAMRVILKTPHNVMRATEFSDIIALLVKIRNSGDIDQLALRLQEFDCHDLDKEIHFIARSLSIVRDPHRNELLLHLLTNRKHYVSGDKVTSKYARNDPLVRLGKGSFKTVKVCLIIEFKSGAFVITPAARATVRISRSVKAVRPYNMSHYKTMSADLSAAVSIDSMLYYICKFNTKNTELCEDVVAVYEEVRISKLLQGIPAVEQLTVGVPFIKLRKNSELVVLSHVYSEKSDGNLSELNISNAYFKSVVTQVLNGLAQIHERGILHRDIKGPNILGRITTGNIVVKFIDFGASVDLKKLRQDTLELLHKLQFSVYDSDGLVDKILLNNNDVSLALLMLNSVDNCETSGCKSTPTLRRINARLARYINVPEIRYMRLHATFGFDAPEVFADIAEAFFTDREKYNSLGKDVYYMLSADARRNIADQIDYKQDVWALGITIVNLYMHDMPSLDSEFIIAFIEANDLLRNMLHPDPNLRCSITDALKIHYFNQELLIPDSAMYSKLSKAYKYKITEYNQNLEKIAANYYAIPTDIHRGIELLRTESESSAIRAAIVSLKTIITMRMSRLDRVQKTQLLTQLLLTIFTKRVELYMKIGEIDTNAIILLILHADIDISAFDLSCITHLTVGDGLSCDLIDAVATLINDGCYSTNSMLAMNSVNIWDIPLASIENIGGPKCAALARYIETVIAARCFDFINKIMTSCPELFTQYAAIFMLDQRLHFALERATGRNMLGYLAESSRCAELCFASNCLSEALNYKYVYEKQYGSNDVIVSYEQLANTIINSLNENCTLNNIGYYLLILRYFVPRLYGIDKFNLAFKKALTNLSRRGVDCERIVLGLKTQIPKLTGSKCSKLQVYARELLTAISSPRTLKRRNTI